MTGVTATAPGKIIVLGEYAVMDGAPAVVLAVDRRATVTVRAGAGPTSTVAAPDIGVPTAAFTWRRDGGITWQCPPPQRARLDLVTTVLDHLTAPGATAPGATRPTLTIAIDTAAFHAAGPGAPKLGLGSSAALTVALAHAAAAALDLPAPPLATLIDLHRAFQGGRGSGFDIAAATHGGALVYRTPETAASGTNVIPFTWPDRLQWRLVYTGRAGATAPLLAQMSAWRAAQPRAAAALFDRLAAAARDGAAAARSREPSAILAAVAAYGRLLAELGRRSGVEIVTADHRELGNLAGAHGVTYKASGAGGGDIGVALATDAAALEAFQRAAQQRGWQFPLVGLADRGVEVSGR